MIKCRLCTLRSWVQKRQPNKIDGLLFMSEWEKKQTDVMTLHMDLLERQVCLAPSSQSLESHRLTPIVTYLLVYFCTLWFLSGDELLSFFFLLHKTSTSPHRLFGCVVALSSKQTDTFVSHSLVLLLFDLLADLRPQLGWAGWTFGPSPAPTGHSYSPAICPPCLCLVWA